MTFQQIYEKLESVGAAIGVYSGSYVTYFSAKCLAEDLPLVLNILATTLQSPTFPPAQIEKERGEILTGLEKREHSAKAMAHLKSQELLYGTDHIYGRSGDGYIETISRIERDDLERFYQTHYSPAGMIISLAGATNATTVFSILEAEFGNWNNSHTARLQRAIPPVRRLNEMNRVDINMPEKVQCELVLGFLGPSRTDIDYLDAALSNIILGQFGLYGRLGDSIRDKQSLAYYCYSHLESKTGPGAWEIVAGLHPTNIKQTINSICAELHRLQDEKVDSQELANNKTYLTGSLPIRLETNGGIAANIINMEFYDLGMDYLQHFAERINSITPELIQAVAQKYLDPAVYTLAVAGPIQSNS